MAIELMSTHRRRPITEISDFAEKEAEFALMLGEAREAAEKRISVSRRNRAFYNGDHYQSGPGWGWTMPLRQQKNAHIPRLSGEETHDAIQNLLPVLIRSKPGTTVIPEDSNGVIDLREMNEFGELEGMLSDVPPSVAAEALTDILEGLYKRRCQHILDSNIVLESLLSGISYVTFAFSNTQKGVLTYPRLLEPDQFLGDPDAYNIWDFSDYRHIMVSEMKTPYEIEKDYGVAESEYAGGSEDVSQQGVIGKYFGRKTETKLKDEYPVHTLYYQPHLSKLDVPPNIKSQHIQKLTFINEQYYVRNSQKPIEHWHKEYPVTAFQSTPRPFTDWGTSEISVLVATQIAINIARDSAIATTLFNASPGYDIEDGAIAKGMIDNTPGGVTQWVQGIFQRGGVNERRARDSSSSFNLWSLMKQQMRDRQGDAQGLLQGSQPRSIKSGVHFNSALNAVLTRHGFRVRMLDSSWERLARHDVSNFQQFVEFDAKYFGGQGDFSEYMGMGEAVRNLKYDISIDSKQDTPANLEEKLTLFLALYDRGLIHGNEFYKQTGISISPDVQERIKIASEDWIPEIPPQEQAVMQQQTEQGIDTLANEQGL